jgi:hypothetical protein
VDRGLNGRGDGMLAQSPGPSAPYHMVDNRSRRRSIRRRRHSRGRLRSGVYGTVRGRAKKLIQFSYSMSKYIMAIQTRSKSNKTAARTLAATQDIEKVFRQIHLGTYVLVNPSDLTEEHRILWWSTGIEEGRFEDKDIPEEDYAAVYTALQGK